MGSVSLSRRSAARPPEGPGSSDEHGAEGASRARVLVAEDDYLVALEVFRRNGIRSIFATAHLDARTRARAEAAAPLGWLPKPYALDPLVMTIERALRA